MRPKFDVVIIGTGMAGLSAAIFLKEAGLNVLAITKENDISSTNTNWAQGGIIGFRKEDSAKLLKQDIVSAGCNYNNQKAVNIFVKKAPKLVNDFFINKLKVEFNRKANGQIDFTGEAAHSLKRMLHFFDKTGELLQSALIKQAEAIGVEILNSHTAVDLITNNHHSNDYQELYKPREVMGVYVLDNESSVVKTIFADNTILATGGIGNLYQHTSNPVSATGDGMSMAYRTGADIINAEFIQFHPTLLFHKDVKRFLISESLRGEGAKLVDAKGRRFMKDYSPEEELAPRDVVARAIYREMKKLDREYMLLNLKDYYKPKSEIPKRFSKIYEKCQECGIDITQESIPIVPAAHYYIGGIKVDKKGKTSIKNLYAIGEVSCTGLHGANRLASASLAEALLWAKNASDYIIKNSKPINKSRLAKIPDWKLPKEQVSFDDLLIEQDWKAIRLTLWNYAGIIRNSRGLDRALADLNYYSHRIFKFYKRAKLTKKIIELRNAVVNANIIVKAAVHNKKSIGCHYITNNF